MKVVSAGNSCIYFVHIELFYSCIITPLIIIGDNNGRFYV